MILLAVSLKDIGKSVLVKSPKNDNIREARVLFLAPVFPIKNNTNFGSQSAILENDLMEIEMLKQLKVI